MAYFNAHSSLECVYIPQEVGSGLSSFVDPRASGRPVDQTSAVSSGTADFVQGFDRSQTTGLVPNVSVTQSAGSMKAQASRAVDSGRTARLRTTVRFDSRAYCVGSRPIPFAIQLNPGMIC